MTALDLFVHLTAAGCQLTMQGDTLRVHDPQHILTDALRPQIREHKAALLAMLSDTLDDRRGDLRARRPEEERAPLRPLLHQRGRDAARRVLAPTRAAGRRASVTTCALYTGNTVRHVSASAWGKEPQTDTARVGRWVGTLHGSLAPGTASNTA
jgi:hypothetical protein